MRVAVTGGTGFIGGFVVSALCGAGHVARCLVRPTSDLSRIAHLPFERAVGDVLDADAVATLVAGCDAVIHLALSAGWDQMRTPAQLQHLLRTSERGTRNGLDAARAAGNVRVVFVSSVAVRLVRSLVADARSPSNPRQAVNCSTTPDRVFREDSPPEALAGTLGYAAIKRAAEALVREYVREGLPVLVLNPAEVYGANDTALVTAGNLKAFLTDPVVLLPRSGGTSICAVEDVAAACVAALTRGRPGERYILGGPNLTVEQLARTTLRLAGGRQPRKPLLRLPGWLLLGAVRALAALRLPVPVEPGVLAFAVLYWFVDSTKASQELGYRQRSAEDILAPVVAWLRQAGHVS